MGSKTPSPPGNFSYPPPGSSLQFNYIDSVVTSWLSFDSNATDCFLAVWYWPNTNPWKIGFNQSAPANGTGIVPLNLFDSSCLGQLNFDYIASDGSPQKIVSPLFSIDTSPQSRPVTWSQGVLTLPTSSTSAALRTSISAPLVTSSDSPASTSTSSKSSAVLDSSSTSSSITTSSTPSAVIESSAISSSLSVPNHSSTNGSDLGTGAIAGIVVGIVVFFGLTAAVIFQRLRKTNSVQAEVKAPSPASFQSPIPAHYVGELDGSRLRPNELSGDGHILEMADGSY